ncbi:MAG TPA: uracil-DNA glycosylase family protein [Gaiellales bacterium]|nr:uracil-DNA glycosylase family protein [Gaiellales bacterium]
MTVADDEIYERYQAKAIDETNALGHDIAEWLGERHPGAAPVLGTGHPLADIMLVKHRPMPAEVQEGVAFFGRAGQAILKSLQRMRIDPLMLYGTACLKAAIDPSAEDLAEARSWLTREIHITQPRIVVTLGDEARDFLTAIDFPLSVPCEGEIGTVIRFTPTIETLAVPDIDRCLDDAVSKQAFWDAFKVLGSWYEKLPPY